MSGRPPRFGSASMTEKVKDLLPTIGAIAAVIAAGGVVAWLILWSGYTIGLHLDWLNPMHNQIYHLMEEMDQVKGFAIKASPNCPATGGVCNVGAESGGYCYPGGLNYPIGTPCESNCYYNGTLTCDGAGNCVGGVCKGDCTEDSQCPAISAVPGPWEISTPYCTDYSAGNCVYQIYHDDLIQLAQLGLGAACDPEFVETCRMVIPEAHRDCFEVNQICTLGAAILPGDYASFEIADIHYACHAQYKCSNHAPLFVV